MPTGHTTVFFTTSLLLFLGFLVGVPTVKAQDAFSSIKIGTTGFADLVAHPAFPESELVVVQFCGPRKRCTITETKTKWLRQKGFDVSFAAVYDSVMFDISKSLTNHENGISSQWGHHWYKTAANQVYILDANRVVIYQGFMPDSENGILAMIIEGTASYHEVQALIDERADNLMESTPGLWFYQGRLIPLKLQLGRFVELNQLTDTKLSLDNDVRYLKSVDYLPGRAMESLLSVLDLSATVSSPSKADEYIVVRIE